ncbi:MAG: S8 family serine peptidase [Clostridiales bacterium]|nr:S8 family serine peptidase [Clostridiales bacterium]
MRDVFGYTGEGVKIGIIDYPFASSSEIDYFQNDTFELYYCSSDALTDTYSSHGNCVFCIIAGYYEDEDSGKSYYGAVPDAKLYATSGIDYRNALEVLLDNGVDVINCSMIFGSDGSNNYGDTAKFMDHIVSYHNVTYVGAAGNSGINSIGSGQMGYNTITVGFCDSNGEISSVSSYNSSLSVYKPDITAPGDAFVLPATRDSSTETPSASGGTSFATPVVTGAVAQLCQAVPALASNPRLMKAVLLAGSTINDYIDKEYMISQKYSGFSRQYGAGILNVLNSYALVSSRQNYAEGTIATTTNSVTTTMNINASAGKLIRVCLVYDKCNTITGSHSSSSSTIVSPSVEQWALTITTPDNDTYSKSNSGDSKIMISFLSTGSGTYTFKWVRTSGAQNTTSTSYGIAASVQNY